MKEFLRKAVEFAAIAGREGNHPCGTVIVNSEGKIIVGSGNKVFTTPDITAHAEMLCIREQSKLLLDKTLAAGCTLYSSCEPCGGCAFYIARSNIKKVVYASKDRYRPGIGMLKNDPKLSEYFHDIELIEEPFADLRDEALILMRDYFLRKGKIENSRFFEPLS